MNKNILPFLTILIVFLMLFFSCGKSNSLPELHLVPGTALLHLHFENGLNSNVTSLASHHVEGFVLADSLLKKGPIGLSLVGIDISTLNPQLLILTQNATIEYATALAARVLDLNPRQEDNRVDLISEVGYAQASVTQRDGWTAIYVGPAPHITIGNWLDLDKDNSLAADTALAKVIPESQHVTVLFPGNLFAFLSMLPLERQIPWWSNYKEVTSIIRPSALSLWITWPEAQAEEPVFAGIMLARKDGGVTTMDISISDTQISTDSSFALLLDIGERMLINE